MSNVVKLFDIAANLADEKFDGVYYGKKHHENDVDIVINRAKKLGVDKFLISSGYYHDCVESYNICKKHEGCYGTVGIHPCRANEVGKDEAEYYAKMEALIEKFKDVTVAIGECGLDYDRFEYANKETQLRCFPIHFDWAHKYNLPMYLHSRNCKDDFLSIVKANRHKFPSAVVHSYTGCKEELNELLKLGLYIGVNGCSLKTLENIEIVKLIPLDRIMLETDSPYCEIRNSHEGSKYLTSKKLPSKSYEKYDPNLLVKGRNEPVNCIEVLQAVAKIKGIDEATLAMHSYENTCKLFNIK